MPLLEIRTLSKHFFRLRAVNEVSFGVEPGELLGLIGPNGSGKTTLFNCVTGILPVTGGQVYFKGEEVTDKTRFIKGPDEILVMRCASHACEAAIAEMEDFTRRNVPGGDVSENAIWAELHAGNIRRGGEWIEKEG